MPNFNREYAEMVPKEIRLSVDSLGGQDDLRFGVVMALLDHEGLPFSRVKEELDVHQQSLSTALSALQRGGVVKKVAGEEIGGERTGEYFVTEYGKQIFDGLYQASQPKYEPLDNADEFVDVFNIKGAKVRTYKANVRERSSVGAQESAYEAANIARDPDSQPNVPAGGVS